MKSTTLLLLSFEVLVAMAAPANLRRSTSSTSSTPYAPINATCPSTPLVRQAKGISSGEQAYISTRKLITDVFLGIWLKSVSQDFSLQNLPAVGLTTSGGGLRSMLEGAGVVQAFDIRDSSTGVSGLYQSLVYHAGLSGGSWLLSSLAGNDWPTVSWLRTKLWDFALANGLLDPGGPNALRDYGDIVADLFAKNNAGFPPTLTDSWGRLLSYEFLFGKDGGVRDRLSGLAAKPQFLAHTVPYPIITSIEVAHNQCLPLLSNPQFELHPFEFGSWDTGIAAFTQTEYLGSSLKNGQPTVAGKCIQNYDNLGYVLGTSSSLFSEACTLLSLAATETEPTTGIALPLEVVHNLTSRDEYGVYPNPFYGYSGSPSVSADTELYLVDGGLSNQNNPIWPFIQPARGAGIIDVLIVNDNSADTSDNFPNGTEIYNTYMRAQQAGLTRMPTIPPVSTFVSQGLNKRATFFGCNAADKLTIVFLPNVNYTFASNQPTARLQYGANDTDAMVANGVLIGTQNGDAQWPTCLACAITKKTGQTQPSACQACFQKYCYN